MRSVITLVALCACGRGSSSNTGAPTADPGEIPTPTERAAAPVQQVANTLASFPEACDAIARDLETLTKQFAQLANYRAVDQKDCRIRYQHQTRAPEGRGGWSAATPAVKPDGVWLYIGIYDPDGPAAQEQIHMQPVVPNWWIGSRRVMFLIKEGDRTTRASGAILKILEKHGLETR